MLLQMTIFHNTSSFLWLSDISWCVCVIHTHILFIQSPVDGPLGCFHVLSIVNSTTMDIGVHVSLHIRMFILSGYMPRTGIAESYGNSIFSFLRNHHIVFHSDCTSLHSHQHCKRVPFFPHPLQNFICRLFDDGHSDRCEVIPQGSFDLRFLITSDVEHLFMCLLEKCHL